MYFLIFLFSFCAIGAAIFFSVRQKEKINKLFSRIANEFKLDFAKGNIFAEPCIKGTYKGFNIKIEHLYATKYRPESNRYTISLNKQLNFTIKMESFVSKIKSAVGYSDILTHDKDFDDMFLINCYEISEMSGLLKITGLLNIETRKLIYNFVLSNDKPTFEITGSDIIVQKQHNENDITKIVDDLVSIAKQLHRKGITRKHLIENFYNERDDKIKENNLRLLLENFSEIENKDKILENALQEKSPYINLLGFKYKKEKSIEELNKIWEKSPEDLKLEIIKLLFKLDNCTDQLIKYFHISYDNVLIEIITALGKIGGKRVNNLFVNHLKRNIKIQEKLAIIKALGNCGDIDTIKILLKQKNLLLQNAAKDSILKIQSRLGTEKKGALSITNIDAKNGALSIKNDKDKDGLSLIES